MAAYTKEEKEESLRIADLELRYNDVQARIKSIMHNRHAAIAELNVFTHQLGFDTCTVDEFFSPKLITLVDLGNHSTTDIKFVSGVMNWNLEKMLSEDLAFSNKIWKDLNKANNAVQHRRAELYSLVLATKEKQV